MEVIFRLYLIQMFSYEKICICEIEISSLKNSRGQQSIFSFSFLILVPFFMVWQDQHQKLLSQPYRCNLTNRNTPNILSPTWATSVIAQTEIHIDTRIICIDGSITCNGLKISLVISILLSWFET